MIHDFGEGVSISVQCEADGQVTVRAWVDGQQLHRHTVGRETAGLAAVEAMAHALEAAQLRASVAQGAALALRAVAQIPEPPAPVRGGALGWIARSLAWLRWLLPGLTLAGCDRPTVSPAELRSLACAAAVPADDARAIAASMQGTATDDQRARAVQALLDLQTCRERANAVEK